MRKVILAIDDNEDFLCTLEDILSNNGYDVKILSDPAKTEEFIDKYDPDLLIIDIFMPKRSGFNILEDFRKNGVYEDIPKVFLTCLDDDIERMTARACGVARYIAKPVRPKELLVAVDALLNPGGLSEGNDNNG